MATGGTIPTNRTQTVTFFNTTGIVDRDKNIYFAPRFSKYAQLSSGRDVRSAYLEIFKTVCPPSSAYADIQISGWSPQDRTLKVRGNIDDFRLVTEEGECLNYFILSRTITKEDVDKTYYYGFVITGVQQAGGGSVLLTVEPDDFTNVFYLHNQYRLTAGDIQNDYEPYNEKIKNAYVNRQHYNRGKYEGNYVYSEEEITGSKRFVSLEAGLVDIEIDLPVGTSYYFEVLSESFDMTLGSQPTVYGYELDSKNHKVIVTLSVEAEASGVYNYTYYIEYLKYVEVFVADNMKVFLNQEETFRFKYQYRDMKYPLSMYDGNFTLEEIESIENENTFANLSLVLRNKILCSCIAYLVVETKSTEIALPYYYSNYVTSGQQSVTYVKKRRLRLGQIINDKELKRPNVAVVVPFMEIPEVFKKYTELESWECRATVNGITVLGRNSYKTMIQVLSKNSVADYIYSVYYAKDVNIPRSIISCNYNTSTIDFSVVIPNFVAPTSNDGVVSEAEIAKGCYIGGILSEPISDDSQITNSNAMIISFINGQFDSFLNHGAMGLVVSGYTKQQFTVTLKEELPDLMNIYYDNVLEAEPYSFYSLSYLSGYEITFNKNRYYAGWYSYINIVHYVAFNGAIKEAYIPVYNVDNFESKYFNEGLIFTTSATLPLVSDSYSSYYYQNQAQMKNQFAVADYQWSTDFAQKFFVSSPNQVGLRASKAGGWGALAETGNQIMGWVDDAIDNAQNKHVIGMNQKAKLADMGTKPDSLKQTGSDILFDLATKEAQPFLNHYTIDRLSYESIAKLFERTGYQVNLYTTLNTMDRVGWNFIKLNACDVVGNITLAQESTIRKILTEGVTLLHDKSYLTSGHNFETILEGGE